MPRVRLKLRRPSEEVVKLSTEHPDMEVRTLASRPTEEGLLLVVEIKTENPEAILRNFEEASTIRSYEVLQIDSGSLLVQHVETEPTGHRVAQATGAIANSPLILRNGWLFMEFLISHDRLSAFTDGLTDAGVTFEMLSVTQSVDVLDLLTERQWQFITETVERGYYDSPRGCSLVDLATALEVSKSTASGILHRAEGRIIRGFVDEPAV